MKNKSASPSKTVLKNSTVFYAHRILYKSYLLSVSQRQRNAFVSENSLQANATLKSVIVIHPPLDKVRKKSSEFQEKTMKWTLHLLLFTI